MAATTVKSPSIVTAAIRLLTSSSTQNTDDSPIQHFEGMLLNKIKQLKSVLLSDTNFDTLRRRLQMKMNENERFEFWKLFLEDELQEMTRETCKGSEGCETESWKVETRWTFVQLCLHLMLELKWLLFELVSEAKTYREKTVPKGPQNPKLNVDALSVSDQKVVLTCVQFIISLGVYPNLLPGVGIPVEKRSGYAHLIKGSENESKNEKHLHECLEVLLDCIKHASLGSIILSRHLGDIITGLIQICHAPTSSYYKSKDSSNLSHVKANTVTGTFQQDDEVVKLSSTSQGNDSGVKTVPCGQIELNAQEDRGSASVSSSLSQHLNPCEAANEWQQFVEVKKIEYKKNNISASQRENCSLELGKLVERVYQPLIIRELLMIQLRGASNPRKQRNTASYREGVNKSVRKQDNHPNFPETPKWFTDICGQLLSARLMKPNGVQAVLRGILENTGDPHSVQDWRKCDMVARLIANCPSQADSVEQYYACISPQVLGLLHITNIELGKQFARVASSTIRTMVKQNHSLTKKYLLDVMMAPMIKVTQIPVEDSCQLNSVVADEAALTQCIEDIHKVFVAGSNPQSSFLLSLTSVIHPIFQLFCFTRKGISHLRSSCQDILVQFLKHAELVLALRTLYMLVYCESPPWTFGLPLSHEKGGKEYSMGDSKASAQQSITTAPSLKEQAEGKGDAIECSGLSKNCQSHDSVNTEHMHIELMRTEYTFGHGDSGGIIIKSCDLHSPESLDDVLGRLTGDAAMNHEVEALCLVELLVQLKNDQLSGEFFLHLMKELTNIVSHEEQDTLRDDLEVYDRQTSAHKRSLLILHLLALMCDKLGPSILKDVHQMLAFVKSTLQRGCALCELEDTEEGLVSETITMAFGMLSAIMGGAVKVEERERSSLQELLPLLERLSIHHPGAEVKEMANDLRIAIATHGAVWSQQMKYAAANLGTQKQERQEDFVGEKDSSKNATNSPSDTQFDRAFAELCDPLLPVRGYAMITLSQLLNNRQPKAVAQADTLLKIFTDQLSHDDSYIYLAAIQGMVALSAIKIDQVLPHLAREFANCRTGEKGKAQYQRSPETKMKLGEALVKAVRECGDLIPRYSQHLMSSLLSGVRDPDEYVRASSLSNIGETCKLLRFSVGPIMQEVLSCLSAVLKTDQSDQVRRAAVLVMTLLLQGLGNDSIQVLSSNLRDMYHLMKTVEACDNDETTRVHAKVALGQLDSIMRRFLFPKETFAKRIQVLT